MSLAHRSLKPTQLLTFILLGAVLSTGLARAEENRLIREYEQLRSSLSPQDPARLGMNLKLADLLFDEAGKAANKVNGTENDRRLAQAYRGRATALYLEALKGNGYLAPISGTQKIKVQFQLARIYSDTNQSGEAEKLWKVLIQQEDIPMVRKEAALRLAEMREANVNSAASVKEADEYYKRAIEYCSAQDVCYYAHYRRGWLLHRLGAHDEALAELRLGLWDSQGNPREEVLRDFVLFWSERPGTGEDALAEIDGISKRLSRPSLVAGLSEAFFSAGNKPAGLRVLELVNDREPSLKHQAQLLEEYYGARDWQKFRMILTQIEGHGLSDAKSEEEKVIRRVIVQLDSERISQKQYADDFKKAALVYLKLYPATSERQKMMDGWLAAETDEQVKLDQLKGWIATVSVGGSMVNTDEEIRLRKIRASIAQKLNLQDIVAEEMNRLASYTPASDPKHREYKYLAARALYETKNNEAALPLFQALASSGTDQWAIQSQHLSLDILNQKKDYRAIIAQTEIWTKSPTLNKQAVIAKELPEVEKIADQATFELATAQGMQSAEALNTFMTFCKAGKFTPKSCENTKVLAVNQKNEPAIIEILKLTGDKAGLATEYEAAAYFGESAKLSEELNPNPKVADSFKLMLLYELAEQNLDRNRILLRVVREQAKKKDITEEEENLLVSLLADAKLLDYDTLKLKPTQKNERRIAHYLAQNGLAGKHVAEINKILLDSPESLGPAWSKLVLDNLRALDAEQRKVKFYGKKSKQNFEKRIALLKKVSDWGEKYLQGADQGTRVEMLKILKQNHEDLAGEVVNSPLPPGLIPEAVEQIKASLTEMAKPFQDKAKAYTDLLATATAPAAEAAIKTSAAAPASINGAQRQIALSALHGNPNDLAALTTLKTMYQAGGQVRLAAYFEGRIRQIQGGQPAAVPGEKK